jgi:hypothetical protein
MENNTTTDRLDITRRIQSRLYASDIQTAFRLEAVGTGGKAGEQPSNCLLYVVQTTYNETTGAETGERIAGLVNDPKNGRPIVASWTAIADGSNRTMNTVTEGIREQFRSEFMTPFHGVCDVARKPLEVKAALETVRRNAAIARNVAGHTVSLPECAAILKLMNPALAPWVNDDGTFRPEAPKAAPKKKTAKK